MKFLAIVFSVLTILSFYNVANAQDAGSVVPAGSVSVAAPAAPPKWAEDLIMSAEKMPVIGPIVSKLLIYAGILSSILTALAAFLLASASALTGALNFAGLASFALKIEEFKAGKFMYYLQYLSMFNAKKPEEKAKV